MLAFTYMKRKNCLLRIKRVMLFFLFFFFRYIFCSGNPTPDAEMSCKLPANYENTHVVEHVGVKHKEDSSLSALPLNSSMEKASFRGDLYIMSLCPYGIQALSRLFEVRQYYSKFNFKVHFITALHGEEFTSLHGSKEVLEDKVWGLVQEEFFTCRTQKGMSLWDCLDKLGIPRKQIENALDTRGERVLLRDYYHVQKYKIHASPTLFVDGVKYGGRFSARDIIRYLCTNETNNALCGELPVCFENSDCNAGVKKGTCADAGTVNAKCVFGDVVNVSLSIIEPDNALFPRLDLEEDTVSFFPGVSIKHLSYTSEEGKKLLRKYGINVLPAYIFGKSLENAGNFSEFSDGLLPVGDAFLYDYKKIRANYFYRRPGIPRTVNIFISPLSKISYINLRALQEEELRGGISVKINYFVTTEPNGEPRTPGGKTGLEEICRQKALLDIAPSLYKRYINIRDFASSYWEDAFFKIGVSPERIKKIARGPKGMEYMRAEQEEVKNLGIEEEGAFLINNRELLIIKNKGRFMKMLSKLSWGLVK